jgi:hypothetical protein
MPQRYQQERQVARDIPEVGDSEQRSLVGEPVIRRVLRDRRYEQERHNREGGECRKQGGAHLPNDTMKPLCAFA